MSEKHAQNLKNHGRIDPSYHYFLLGILTLNLAYAALRLYRDRTLDAGWFLVLSVTALVLLVKVRVYPMKVQDRVIRLEERLRLQALAPAEWHTQIYKLTEDQLIGLRFAGEDEVVELAKQALELNLDRKQIKQRIRSWRADTFRI